MSDAGVARQSCLASNAAWRRQASHLRQHAAIPHLTEQQRLCLLREAEAADHQADMWLAGAIETRSAGPRTKLRPPPFACSGHSVLAVTVIKEITMSRRTIPAHAPGLTVVVGWDNPLGTFFAQVARALESDDDESDPIVFWAGGEFGEVPHAEDLVDALAPYAALTPEVVAQLRTDRAACADRGPSPLQREMLRHIGRRA